MASVEQRLGFSFAEQAVNYHIGGGSTLRCWGDGRADRRVHESSNLGHWAHPAGPLEHLTPLGGRTLSWQWTRVLGLTHWGSVSELPTCVIRTFRVALTTAVISWCRTGSHPETLPHHRAMSMNVTWFKRCLGFSAVEVCPAIIGTLWILQRVILTYLFSSFPLQVQPLLSY